MILKVYMFLSLRYRVRLMEAPSNINLIIIIVSRVRSREAPSDSNLIIIVLKSQVVQGSWWLQTTIVTKVISILL